MKKIILIYLTILSFSATLIISIIKPFAEEKPKVVIVLKELDTQYWKIVEAGAEKGFQDFGIDGKVVAPRKLERGQEDILKVILKENPDVLIVSPDTSSVTPILDKFVVNNIPVLLLDTDIPWKRKTSYIGTDNFELGRIAGALLASHLQPGDKVAILTGDVNIPVAGERLNGAKSSLEVAGIKVAAERVKLLNEPWIVKRAMENILMNYPDVKGVFATTDIYALNAQEAIESLGYKIPVIGADGILEMAEEIEDGAITDTVAQNPYDMGYLSVETALKVIKGERVDKKVDTGIDIITSDNVNQKLDFMKKMLR